MTKSALHLPKPEQVTGRFRLVDGNFSRERAVAPLTGTEPYA
jgi:hypothetical protein